MLIPIIIEAALALILGIIGNVLQVFSGVPDLIAALWNDVVLSILGVETASSESTFNLFTNFKDIPSMTEAQAFAGNYIAIAELLLVIFTLIAICKASTSFFEMKRAETVLKVFLKFAVCFFIIHNATTLLGYIYDFGLGLGKLLGVSESPDSLKIPTYSQVRDLYITSYVTADGDISNLDFLIHSIQNNEPSNIWDAITGTVATTPEVLNPWRGIVCIACIMVLFVSCCMNLVKVVFSVLERWIRILIYIIVAPLVAAMFVLDESAQYFKKYAFGFLAVGLELLFTVVAIWAGTQFFRPCGSLINNILIAGSGDLISVFKVSGIVEYTIAFSVTTSLIARMVDNVDQLTGSILGMQGGG